MRAPRRDPLATMDRYVAGWRAGAAPRGPTTVHVVRHGESLHNASYFAALGADANDARYVDAGLTPRGAGQADALVGRVAALEPQLVVCSPMTRAIDTCLRACANLNLPPRSVLAHPACTEKLSYSCDVGSPLSALLARFPTVNFDAVAGREVWWWRGRGDGAWSAQRSLEELRGGSAAPRRGVEPTENVLRRVGEFRRWLVERAEQRILVFAHGVYLRHLLAKSPRESVPWLDNCEVRKFVL
jgi:glucosyl-3-phosphoglycerate phosphatase